MTDNTELSEIESNQESEVNTQDTQETLNSEPEIVEQDPIPNPPEPEMDDLVYRYVEPKPEPWENAPEGLVYYEKIYEDGHLGSFTKSPELAYKFGWFENSIPEEDLEVSDVNGWTYRKDVCPMKTEEQIQQEFAERRFKDIQNAVQNLLDSKAKEKNYDNGFAIASYALSTNDTFRSEAGRFIAWRDAVWGKCYQILDAYKAGEIEMPSVENVIAVLPELEWDDE